MRVAVMQIGSVGMGMGHGIVTVWVAMIAACEKLSGQVDMRVVAVVMAVAVLVFDRPVGVIVLVIFTQQ